MGKQRRVWAGLAIATTAAATAGMLAGCGGDSSGSSSTSSSNASTPQAEGPPRNPYLSADVYPVTHVDPAQSDSIPYPVARGTFHVDPPRSRVPRVVRSTT